MALLVFFFALYPFKPTNNFTPNVVNDRGVYLTPTPVPTGSTIAMADPSTNVTVGLKVTVPSVEGATELPLKSICNKIVSGVW